MNFIENFCSMKTYKQIYIRNELSNKELRTPITPIDVNILINLGFTVYVESSNKRIYSNEEYISQGAIITTSHWSNFTNTIIIGLKCIDNLNLLDNSSHIYFSHSFLNQNGSDKILNSFAKSKSVLLDLEFFLKDGYRIVTFGYWAGYVGTALALKQYYNKINGKENINGLSHWESIDKLHEYLSDISFDPSIRIGLIGPNGNCGLGAKKILNKLGLNYIPYYRNSNKNNMENLDIVINCVKLSPILNEVWFDSNTQFYKPIVISDISCDYTKPNNPIKIYNESSTWTKPIISPNRFVDIISIDNLPSMIPKESSDDFSKNLVSLLEEFETDPNGYFQANMEIYIEKITKYI